MKILIVNGQPMGTANLEEVKAKYPGASILALPYKISVITR